MSSLQEKIKTANIPTSFHDLSSEIFNDLISFKILIVDNEIDQLKLLERYVSSFGYDCMTAENDEQALERLNKDTIDLVITNMMMPNMNGFELLKRIQNKFPHVATIILSGHGNNYTCNDIIQFGAYEFIEKPAGKDVLEAKIKRVFRKKILFDSYVREVKTQKILLELLSLSSRNKPLSGLLHDFLLCITDFPWLSLEPKGALFLVDEHDQHSLILTAYHNLPEELLEVCEHISFGHCLCGQVAQKKELIFESHIGENHHNRVIGIQDHGHYCVPILQADGELLGVFSLHLKPGTKRNSDAESMFLAAAQTIAGIIATKKNDARTADSERRYHALTDNTLDALVMMDNSGAISFWNPAATAMFGYTQKESIGKNLHQLLAPDRYTLRYPTPLQHFLETGEGDLIGKTIELVGRGKNGREFPLELSLSSLKIHDEWQAIGVIRDISIRKSQEKEKEILNLQLRQAQKLEAIGTLAGGFAHDFNNILGTIIGFAEMVKDDVPAESQTHSDIERILAAGNRAKDLVSQILTFSRLQKEAFIPTQIQPLLHELLAQFQDSIPDTITIRQNIDPACPAVMADPSQLQQVIINLCTNACYAMRNSGGLLSIELKELFVDTEQDKSTGKIGKGHYLQLTVEDSGEGMEPEAMEQIFDPYFTTKPQGDGTGLGLSLVHGIVKKIGGAIEVKSAPGHGATFTISLPIPVELRVTRSNTPDNSELR